MVVIVNVLEEVLRWVVEVFRGGLFFFIEFLNKYKFKKGVYKCIGVKCGRYDSLIVVSFRFGLW